MTSPPERKGSGVRGTIRVSVSLIRVFTTAVKPSRNTFKPTTTSAASPTMFSRHNSTRLSRKVRIAVCSHAQKVRFPERSLQLLTVRTLASTTRSDSPPHSHNRRHLFRSNSPLFHVHHADLTVANRHLWPCEACRSKDS